MYNIIAFYGMIGIMNYAYYVNFIEPCLKNIDKK